MTESIDDEVAALTKTQNTDWRCASRPVLHTQPSQLYSKPPAASLISRVGCPATV